MATTETKPVPAGAGASSVPAARPIDTLRGLLDRSKSQIASALPKHLTPERQIRIALTSLQRTPKLLECEPLSVVGCVIQASELGLELTGPLGQCYMVPYWNSKTKRSEAQFQVGYRGLIKLAHNSGQIDYINAHCVHINDAFDYQYGTRQYLSHKPANGPRGDIVSVYAAARLKTGSSDFEVMSRDEINAHRGKYSKSSAGGPWDTAWEEMARKTVIRRLCKRLPLSADVMIAASIDEDTEPVVVESHQRQAVADRLAIVEAAETPALAEGEVHAEGNGSMFGDAHEGPYSAGV